MAMRGQTYVLPKYKSAGWFKQLNGGGIIRTKDSDGKRVGDYYLQTSGVGSLVSAEYVDGYMVGPNLTLGHVAKDNSRLEADVMARYSFSRHCWLGGGALRFILPPEYGWQFEAYSRRMVTDFDSDPLTPFDHQLFVTGLFGWNGYKLYQRTDCGVKASMAVTDDMQVEVQLGYEDREQMDNHKKRNIFRIEAKSNIPRVRGHLVDDVSDPLLYWRKQHIWHLNAGISYSPGRVLCIYDDLHSEWKTSAPIFGLKLQAGWQDRIESVSTEVSVQQKIARTGSDHEFAYHVAAGFFPIRDEVSLIDYKHFDASRFRWQTRGGLTWFALLSNYELSTCKPWAEMHGEWKSREMLFSRWFRGDWFKEYMQIHFVSTDGHRSHTELTYGTCLGKKLDVGCSWGWNGSSFDGAAFRLIWDF